jgi:hypothetical protein
MAYQGFVILLTIQHPGQTLTRRLLMMQLLFVLDGLLSTKWRQNLHQHKVGVTYRASESMSSVTTEL